VDLDEVADELYEVPPEEFIALRTARQDEAKADGDTALARDIGALPKPSTAAWVSNLLVRAHRPEIESLVELGGLLREAQENLAGDQLRALDTQRRQLVNALTRQARSLAYERGHPVSTSVATQVEETLRAAMADPEAGEALLTGRITSPMSYSGMGTTVARPDLRLVRPPAAERTPPSRPGRPSRATDGGRRPSADDRRRAREREREEARRAAEEQRRRDLEEARRVAEETTALAAEAQAAADDERQRIDELEARRTSLEARVAELADQLSHAEGEVAEVAGQLKRAERRRKSAEHEAAEAVVARERARARVEEFSGAED
jgi:hypothetical protein